jgi:YVTN family beta-propeller protein
VTPDGSKVYVTNAKRLGPGTVSVIATATNTVTATIAVGVTPGGVAVTPDGSKVYVANFNSKSVSVIATATNTVTCPRSPSAPFPRAWR